MPNMDEIEYTQEKPHSQECPICLEEVSPDDIQNGIPNCVTCKNSHYLHRECYNKMSNHKCPICREDVKYNCRGYHGYIKSNRKGGFKRSKRVKRRSKSVKRSKKKRSKTKKRSKR